jgi:hypothetical protein
VVTMANTQIPYDVVEPAKKCETEPVLAFAARLTLC